MNFPTKLTVARLLAVPVFMVFTIYDTLLTRSLALLIFVGAGITDLVDGYLARKHNMVTALGIFLDPLADKLIITAAFIAFVEIPSLHIPSWMVVAIVGREFLITGLRSVAASQGRLVPADDGGKFKTSVQNTAIITILVALIVTAGLERYAGLTMEVLHGMGGWRGVCAQILDWVPFWLVFAATAFSVVTGVNYVWRHRQLLRDAS